MLSETMLFGKEKERLEMLERITDALSRSIDDLTAEVNVLRTELDEIKKTLSQKTVVKKKK
jgi:regulator of replication initiation timing